MSWAFLVVACWGALWTLVSFRPPNRPPALMMIGFFAAWSTTELAPLHLAVQILATGVFVALGALDAWPGWIAVAITAVSWFGLGSSVKGSLQTDRVFASALRDALGPRWERDLESTFSAGRRELAWSRVFLPLHFKRRGVQRVRNVPYAEGGLRRHRLDVYRSPAATASGGAPVLLQIHGGGWMIGRKDQQGLPLMYALATNGWVCVAINYRLSPRATWPDQLVDCKRALAWIRAHVAEYGGDPDTVVVTGGSAGGHLAAMVGLTANEPRWQPGFEDADTSVRAMVPFYGVFDWTERVVPNRGLRDILERHIVKQRLEDAPDVYRDASPLSHVHADAPPALVVHGDLDTLAPVGQARAFVAALRATSRQPVVYVELSGAHHAFEVFNSIRTLHTVAGVERFLAWLLSAARAGLSRSGAGPTCSARAVAPPSDPRPTARTEPSRSPPA